jgi:hypothetical protein
MMGLAFITISTFCFSFGKIISQEWLVDGKYRVDFKRYPESSYFLTSGETAIKESKAGVREEGTIEWRGDSHFVLPLATITNGNPVGKQIIAGLGPACYELKRKDGQIIYFRLTRSANLSICLDEGTLTRIDK